MRIRSLRRFVLFVVVAGALSLASACNAILGIDAQDLPGEEAGAGSSMDAAPPGDATTADSARDATTAADGGDGGDGSPAFPYSGETAVGDPGYEGTAVALSPGGECMAVSISGSDGGLYLFEIDGGYPVTKSSVFFGTVHDMVFDQSSEATSALLFAQGTDDLTGAVDFKVYHLANCAHVSPEPVFTDAGASASSLAIAGSHVLIGSATTNGAPGPSIVDYESAGGTSSGQIVFADAGIAGPTSIAASTSGSVVAAIVNGQLYITSLTAIDAPGSIPYLVPTLTGSQRVAVEQVGRRVFVLTGEAANLELVDLASEVDGGWGVANVFAVPSTNEFRPPTLTVSKPWLVVSSGDSSDPIYLYDLGEDGAIISPPTRWIAPGNVTGIAASMNGGELGVSTDNGAAPATVLFAAVSR